MNWVFALPGNRLENLGPFPSQPSRLIDQFRPVPKVRPRHESIAGFSELQPPRRQMVSTSEFLKAWIRVVSYLGLVANTCCVGFSCMRFDRRVRIVFRRTESAWLLAPGNQDVGNGCISLRIVLTPRGHPETAHTATMPPGFDTRGPN